MISTHRGSFMAGGWLWYLGGILMISGVLALSRAEFSSGLMAVLFGAAVLVMPVLRWKQTLELDEAGLTLTKLTGVTKVPREQLKKVTLVRHHGRTGSYESLELALNDGREIEIAGIERAEEAANLVHAMIGARS
jgi:hypothetical protein